MHDIWYMIYILWEYMIPVQYDDMFFDTQQQWHDAWRWHSIVWSFFRNTGWDHWHTYTPPKNKKHAEHNKTTPSSPAPDNYNTSIMYESYWTWKTHLPRLKVFKLQASLHLWQDLLQATAMRLWRFEDKHRSKISLGGWTKNTISSSNWIISRQIRVKIQKH